jgi:hypothetical protein
MLESWYLDPGFQGSDATRAGLANEPVIFGMLTNYLEQVSYMESNTIIASLRVEHLRNIGAYPTNLQCRRVDHICILKIALKANERDEEILPLHEICCCELKTKAKAETQEAEIEAIRTKVYPNYVWFCYQPCRNASTCTGC